MSVSIWDSLNRLKESGVSDCVVVYSGGMDGSYAVWTFGSESVPGSHSNVTSSA